MHLSLTIAANALPLLFVAAPEPATTGWTASQVFWAVITVINWTIRIGALFIVPPNRKPTSALAWLMAIFLLPIPAAIVFFVIGNKNLPRAREAKQIAVNDTVTALSEKAGVPDPNTVFGDIPGIASAARLAQRLGAQPMVSGNAAAVTFDYEASIQQIADAIDQAKTYVHIEFYILEDDKTTDTVFQALRRAKDRGVEVRVMLDHIAAKSNPLTKETAKRLDEVTTAWCYMLRVRPLHGEYQRPDLRNHRKLAVIDGKVGFMGSQNLVDSSYNKKSNLKRGLHWRDIMVRLEGPIVLGLEAIFQGDWYMETGENVSRYFLSSIDSVERPGDLYCQLVPSGPGYEDENNLQVFVALMYTAQKRISITSPYFVPDGSVMNALRAATARGVQVELFVSETGDQAMVYHAQRSYYDELLRAGVRIWMFKPPYILHSKHFSIDDRVAVIGSSNMDERSFNLNMEVSMVVVGREFAERIDEVTEQYRANSRELTAEEWSRQPWQSRLLDNLARLTSALQ